MDEDISKSVDPKYAPPYPQNFHTFWPKHAIKAGTVVLIVVSLIVLLAYNYRLPTDPMNNPTLPDDGMYIPGPEWTYLFFFQPFWYLKDNLAQWRFVGTLIIPLVFIIFIVAIPFIFRKKRLSGIIWRVIAFLPFILIGAGIIYSGYPAKLHGCPTCHSPEQGVRQAYPPMNVAEFYKVDRASQIEVGKYRASKVEAEEAGGGDVRGEVETYKDANWQLRHIYEPTFTW